MIKKLMLFGGIVLLFSGCSIFEAEKPKIFIPKDSISETASASILIDNISVSKKKIKKEGVDFFLIAQKYSSDEVLEFRLYSNDEKPCAQHREEISNVCVFEVWKKEQKQEKEIFQKIFFFEETESGQFSEYYSGTPIGWTDDGFIVFEAIQEKKSGIKHVFSGFHPETQEYKRLYFITFWKDFSTQELDGFMSLTQNGTQYFFDPISYDNSFRAYRVIDATQPFYIKSSGLENLSFLGQVPEKNIQKVEWEEEFSKIIFQVTFLDKEGVEQSKKYEFSGKLGFQEV